jgi:hypothetical protein
VDAHQAMADGPQLVLIVGAVILFRETDDFARIGGGVFGDQILDLGFRCVVQGVVGGAHVGEFGVAA